MNTITKIDRNTANEISKATEAALKEVAERFGITVTIKGGKFDPANGKFLPKVEFCVEGAADNEWNTNINLLRSNWTNHKWLFPGDYKRVIKMNGKEYELVGINIRAPKFPIEAKCLTDGKSYRLTEPAVRKALGRTQAGVDYSAEGNA